MQEENHKKKAIQTSKAPEAIGPYSQAVSQGPWVFCSGQIPIDMGVGKLLEADISKQTELVLNNLKAVLEEAGADLDSVVSTRIYLTDFADFKTVNLVYGEFFKAPYPARATVGVKELPLGAKIEIEAIAFAK